MINSSVFYLNVHIKDCKPGTFKIKGSIVVNAHSELELVPRQPKSESYFKRFRIP